MIVSTNLGLTLMSSLLFFLLTSIFYFQPEAVNVLSMKVEVKTTTSSNKQAPSTQRGNPHPNSFPPPKVVILPGPHKTGSSSLQTCLVDWTWNGASKRKRERKENPVSTPLALPDWAWAVPDSDVLEKAQLLYTNPVKAFASYLGIVDRDFSTGLSQQGRIDTKRIITDEKVQNVTDIFRSSMQKAWNDGYNVVFGTEGMDRLVMPMHTNASVIMDAITDIIPLSSGASNRMLTLRDVEAVVIYRRPRIKHLISVWHQEQRAQESLQNYLENRLLPHSRYLDALGVAKHFLQRGIRTTIVDLTGVSENFGNQTNICHVVACDILRTSNCTQDNHQLTSLATHPNQDISLRPQNQRPNRGSMDVPSEKLVAIEKILMEYDCGFRKIFRRFKAGSMLRYLYNDDIFASCYSLKETDDYQFPQRSLRWMADNIRSIVRS